MNDEKRYTIYLTDYPNNPNITPVATATVFNNQASIDFLPEQDFFSDKQDEEALKNAILSGDKSFKMKGQPSAKGTTNNAWCFNICSDDDK